MLLVVRGLAMHRRKGPNRGARVAGYAVIALWFAVGSTARAAQVQPDASPPPTPVSGLDVPAMIQAADWIHKPGPFQIFAFLPRKFAKSGITGKVVLKCKVLPTASVSDCSVVSDTNPDGVLGDAALKASALFKIRPRMVNGTLSDYAWVLIPISINLGKLKI
jgi:TonB family protein